MAWWQSDQAFADSFERAVQAGTDWMVTHPETENCALLYMLGDMAALSGDVRLRRIVDNAGTSSVFPPDSPSRLWFDPNASVRHMRLEELNGMEDYERWCFYAMAPEHVELSEADRSDMFAPDRFMWGSRTHQLLALILYKNRTANTPAVTDLMNHLSEKIAAEEDWDIRVTDLYLQRMAFILAAGRPDLIRRRWVERAIANQHADGGWKSSWYGLGPRLFQFHLHKKVPNSHTTVQGVWTLYMLKYRYPDWLRRNAPTASWSNLAVRGGATLTALERLSNTRIRNHATTNNNHDPLNQSRFAATTDVEPSPKRQTLRSADQCREATRESRQSAVDRRRRSRCQSRGEPAHDVR